MITSETLGQLGARTKQTAHMNGGVSVMAGSGSAFIDGCMGGPICNASPGGIYGAGFGADAPVATAGSNNALIGIAASVALIGGLLFLIRRA